MCARPGQIIPADLVLLKEDWEFDPADCIQYKDRKDALGVGLA